MTTKLMTGASTLALAIATAISACASAPSEDASRSASAVVDDDAHGFTVGPNDVTYVFPYLPGSSDDLSLMVAADERAGDATLWADELWSPSSPGTVIYDAQHLSSLRGESDLRDTGSPIRLHSNVDFAPGADDRHAWKVTTMRFDPCAGSACATELRLVLMPLAREGDAAAHFIYRFDTEMRDAMLVDLVRLAKEARRIAPTSAGPLAVHPALVSSERRSFAQLVREFILRYARRDHLVELAFFGEIWRSQFGGGSSDIWEFFKGAVGADGRSFALNPIPNAFAAASLGPQRSQMVNVRMGFISPSAARSFDSNEVAAARAATPTDADCASCHHTGRAGLGTMVRNLRMVGPFRGEMTIKPRVVAETNQVVARVNDLLR